MGLLQIVVLATFLSAADGQLATENVVATPILDMADHAIQSVGNQDSVEQLEKKVLKSKEAKTKHENAFSAATMDESIDSVPKLAYALRQTTKNDGNEMLEACYGNDICMDTLFSHMDKNNDGRVEAGEYKEYIVDDGTNSEELREKRKAAGKVLRTLRTADVNGDDVISPQEFEQWRQELDLVDESALNYETFDADQDGEVSKREFARAILKLVEAKQEPDGILNINSANDLIQGAHELVDVVRKHSNLKESFKAAAELNFKQRLNDVPQMNLDGAMDILKEANAKVMKINDKEKNAPQFVIKLEGKEYRFEGSSKRFYQNVGHLTDQGFNPTKAVRAMVAAEGHEAVARKLLCQSEEAEDVEVCDEMPMEDANQESTSFAESDREELSEEEQEAEDEMEDRETSLGARLDDGTKVESEILLPAANQGLSRFRRQKDEVMNGVVESMTEAERKALLSNKGRKHLRQLMPKHADTFAEGMEDKDERESTDAGKKDAASALLDIVKTAAKPAIDVADLGIQMVLGPKNEFIDNLPKKADKLMIKFNEYMGF